MYYVKEKVFSYSGKTKALSRAYLKAILTFFISSGPYKYISKHLTFFGKSIKANDIGYYPLGIFRILILLVFMWWFSILLAPILRLIGNDSNILSELIIALTIDSNKYLLEDLITGIAVCFIFLPSINIENISFLSNYLSCENKKVISSISFSSYFLYKILSSILHVLTFGILIPYVDVYYYEKYIHSLKIIKGEEDETVITDNAQVDENVVEHAKEKIGIRAASSVFGTPSLGFNILFWGRFLWNIFIFWKIISTIFIILRYITVFLVKSVFFIKSNSKVRGGLKFIDKGNKVRLIYLNIVTLIFSCGIVFIISSLLKNIGINIIQEAINSTSPIKFVQSTITILCIIPFVFLIMIPRYWYYAELINYLLNNTRLNNMSFAMKQDGGKLMLFSMYDMFLMVFSFGILYPYTLHKKLSYFSENLVAKNWNLSH